MTDIPIHSAQDFRIAAPAAPATAAAGHGWMVRVLIMWLTFVVLLLVIDAPQIAIGRFADPDDALRLMEVRDLIGGQGWFDLHQYRIAAPAGVAMHWSRLVDIPLAAMILALRPLVGMALAETITIIAVPLLTLLAALLLIGRLSARFFDTETVGITCLVTGIAGPLLFQMTPMRIDHHGWQVVLALAALNGMAARDAVRGGAVVGLSLAALLAISIEGLPITAVFVGVLALRGLQGRGYSGLAAAAAALAGGSLLLFAGTRGFADLATHCDQVSPVHIVLFTVVAAGFGAIRYLAPQRRVVALAMLGGTGAAALALYLGVAPQCRGGAFVALDPVVYHFWYQGVSEGMPFWTLPPAIALETVGVPLVGLGALAWLWRSETDAVRRAWWADHALLLAGALLVAADLARASATACALAAIPTGAVLLRLIVALRTVPVPRRVAGYCALLVLLMPPIPVIAWSRLSAALAWPAAAADPAGPITMSRCKYRIAAQALDRLPQTDLFLPLDIGPDILVRSHQRVVATGHHRGADGMKDVITAFLGTPDQAHAIIRRRHATWIAVCPDIPEPANYRHYAPNGFMAQLLDGKTPAWLEPVDLAPASHLRFWRVKG